LTTRAIAQGLDPATPAIAVASATRPTETAVTAPVAQIADRLGDADIKGPVLVLIGRALESAMAVADHETSPNLIAR
jgi:uroporphyrin-III C-methyltransferase/precorrin-2 dehydrogenase/sirohydrochlorin ferrochelatase